MVTDRPVQIDSTTEQPAVTPCLRLEWEVRDNPACEAGRYPVSYGDKNIMAGLEGCRAVMLTQSHGAPGIAIAYENGHLGLAGLGIPGRF